MNNNADFTFFSKWLKAPRQVASIAPSSSHLSRAMAACLPSLNRPVVELGGGTGPITHAILAAGVAPRHLYVVERDQEFCLHLRRRFPGITVLRGDALELEELLSEHVTEPVSAIVSGLPLLAMPNSTHERLLRQTLTLTQQQGCYIQYSYGRKSPIKEPLVAELGMQAHCVKRVWNNLPPAKVWVYQHHQTRVPLQARQHEPAA
jgi:phosphatidylethanolamine/phosphatidyl-N-methylethanolamine N-methyltransferase